MGGRGRKHEAAAEWTHGQVEGLISPDTALLSHIEWLWIAVSAPFRGITALLTLAVVFIEALACLKHIVRTTLGTKCVFLSPFMQRVCMDTCTGI